MAKIEIIICTEKGYLESMSKLLISSLREFGGNLKDVPIISYQPRKMFKISNETITFFKKNNVEHVDIELNTNYCYYPFANKPLACAHREMNTNADILIFLDSDVFFLNEPSEFLDLGNEDVILRPVDTKNIGAKNSEDQNAIYWNNLYELLGVKGPKNTITTGANENIWEYYNTGHIVTLKKNSLFKTWSENFLKVMDAGIRPDLGLYFVEQSVFSATVSQMELKVKHFSREYNYPIHLEHSFTNQKYLANCLKDLVSIHYHKIFTNKTAAKCLRKQFLKTGKGRKLNKLISDFNILQQLEQNNWVSIIQSRLIKKFNKILKRL